MPTECALANHAFPYARALDLRVRLVGIGEPRLRLCNSWRCTHKSGVPAAGVSAEAAPKANHEAQTEAAQQDGRRCGYYHGHLTHSEATARVVEA